MPLCEISALILFQKEIIYDKISTVIQIYPLYYRTKGNQGI